MKGCFVGFMILALAALLLGGALLWIRKPELRNAIMETAAETRTVDADGPTEGSPGNSGPGQSPNVTRSGEGPVGTSTSTRSPGKPGGFHQYWDADKAFAVDELFAVTSKYTIRREFYNDRSDRNPFGHPTTKFHAPVYIVRAMGRETRENYLFIVTREFYDAAKNYQKFTKTELSNFEYFLSEEKLNVTIFHRRFRDKMID